MLAYKAIYVQHRAGDSVRTRGHDEDDRSSCINSASRADKGISQKMIGLPRQMPADAMRTITYMWISLDCHGENAITSRQKKILGNRAELA